MHPPFSVCAGCAEIAAEISEWEWNGFEIAGFMIEVSRDTSISS